MTMASAAHTSSRDDANQVGKFCSVLTSNSFIASRAGRAASPTA
jgi:hypothetical protein